ncbi:ATP synthase F1, epsilon subunit [Syntrophotalea carbinolica DSM 2380]|uniref:ATP synthase epsilon chain 1 n=1 Tax=Syntrophotalea carbinolica (strain DSM 2380 / NBRC 103641 / GraBd1) TaxID=338963 RepID=ATPE1_SYNC1|nr:F0F1 ATP synthase subunit epsilon [Syntrophotalea carbinolica]Q3A604.1 RecName: Full=ATP synthase epsilon chain 1; AltName: Full=ATP synthase F1 sector epsilon subunit 1; AltName: Full=F-ATPase epsilon subunit 1 [Syntrophotalea carbinolica DSM 2380]ABA88203.1 ATP synthase F1, epsilon subunit [Syntrophotalea carbinolica DSM 2380]
MAQKLKLEMVTPAAQVLIEEVDEIAAPGSLGQFGVLPGHTPLLTTLQVGEFSYRKGSDVYYLAVNWGYVEVAEDRVLVLVETAETQDHIDLARAKAALGRAEARLRELTPADKEYHNMQAALQRAMVRIQVAGRGGRG